MKTSDYARQELKDMLASPVRSDNVMANQILEICEVFDSQYNSEESASYEISALFRLLKYKPLSPLTGNDEEWEYLEDGTVRNKRCPQIFKDEYGNAYNAEAVIFSDDGKSWYMSDESHEYIRFPYIVPKEPKKVIKKRAVTGKKSKITEISDTMPKRITTKHVLDHKGKEYRSLAAMCREYNVSYGKVYRIVTEKGVQPKDAVLYVLDGGSVRDYEVRQTP